MFYGFFRLVILFSSLYCRCSFLKISLFLYGINLSLEYFNPWLRWDITCAPIYVLPSNKMPSVMNILLLNYPLPLATMVTRCKKEIEQKKHYRSKTLDYIILYRVQEIVPKCYFYVRIKCVHTLFYCIQLSPLSFWFVVWAALLRAQD